ncbi:MAG: orotidine-5'-phosphate decarboxylase [Spirochaetota bacterium]
MNETQTYLDLLRDSFELTGSLVCMGLDPVLEYLPEAEGAPRSDLNRFYRAIFRHMKLQGVFPGAFKPNIGYFSALDRPREGDFSGSLALADLLEMLENLFPGIPVILDAKRGDIARSSLNYAQEAFSCWQADAVTVSPYMGSDSVSPFMVDAKGIYVLNRTSNPGAADLQDVTADGTAVFEKTSRLISSWAARHPGLGAVVGATSPAELQQIAQLFAADGQTIPLLIPGVGSQGGSASEVVGRLKDVSYELGLVRINSSSGITHPWKDGPIPEDWEMVVVGALRQLNEEIDHA